MENDGVVGEKIPSRGFIFHPVQNYIQAKTYKQNNKNIQRAYLGIYGCSALHPLCAAAQRRLPWSSLLKARLLPLNLSLSYNSNNVYILHCWPINITFQLRQSVVLSSTQYPHLPRTRIRQLIEKNTINHMIAKKTPRKNVI